MKRLFRGSRVACAAVGIAALVGVKLVSAQQTGDIVEILIPAAGAQPEPNPDPKDKLIITGGKITTTDITGCGAGTHPVQNAVLVDPDAARSGRIVGVIISSQTDRVHPGTKLKGLQLDATCTIAGTAYNRYNGTVE
jgi:hypothetical protein